MSVNVKKLPPRQTTLALGLITLRRMLTIGHPTNVLLATMRKYIVYHGFDQRKADENSPN